MMWRKKKSPESLLRLLINSMPVLISYVDSDMHYRFINEQYETWFNQPRAEIEGKHIRDVIGESAYQTAYQHVKGYFPEKRLILRRSFNTSIGRTLHSGEVCST